MANLEMLNEESIEDIRKGWDRVKILKEEAKSLSEDIAEEKKDISKKTGIAVKDLNKIFKFVEAKEKGDWSEEDVEIADRIAAKITLTPPRGLNE